MLTMQELTQHFKPILARTIDTKEPTENGIKIPYKNIARVCIEFAPGESYSFFGSAKECALSLWRINLMWQLAKKGVPTHLTARKLELKWRGGKGGVWAVWRSILRPGTLWNKGAGPVGYKNAETL